MIPSSRLIWLVVIAGFPAAALAALSPAARIAAAVCLLALAIAALADAFLRSRSLDGIRVELPALVRLFRDRESEIRVRIHHARSGRIRLGIAVPNGIEAEFEEQDVDLPERTKASEFVWKWTARRRGLYRVDMVYLEAASPWGLWRARRKDAVAMEIRAYPNLRRKDDLKALRQGVSGAHSQRQVGRGREFEKLREYLPGDALDEIHWRATARHGKPITKVFQVERTQELYVIIDASRLSARPVGEETVLERAISAGLIVGSAAEKRGDLFGLAAFSDQVNAFVRARNGKAHYAACRDAIYQLHPKPVSPDFDEIATFLRLRLRRRAMVLFLTSLDDPVLAENFARATQLLARRHLVLAGMLRPASARKLFENDVETVEDIYKDLAGHIAWRRLKELEASLARRGVRLSVIDPENYSSALIGIYDNVKQRQLL
ncbi:MAG TPA: DUF58 domain-containing protein [Bryobacteraceae bacterium]|nr:DUF58 domain-containing protein [Bryobacteraceae bacterium]